MHLARQIERDMKSFRLTLPSYRQHELHDLLAYHWDIVVALWIVEHIPRPLETLDVAQAAHQLAFHFSPDDLQMQGLAADRYTSFFGVSVEAAMRDEVDLERPVLLAQIETHPRSPLRVVLMDGYHRLYKAVRCGKPFLKAYMLSASEEILCRY